MSSPNIPPLLQAPALPTRETSIPLPGVCTQECPMCTPSSVHPTLLQPLAGACHEGRVPRGCPHQWALTSLP